MFLFPSLYPFPGNIHSLASFTRWNNAAFIGFGFSVLQAVEGSEITTHIRGDHEASMNLFLGKIWHLKVHYENHIHILYTLGFRGFWGGSTFLEPYYICIYISFHYTDIWKIAYQPEFTPISVFLFLQKGHSLWLARCNFSVKRFGVFFTSFSEFYGTVCCRIFWQTNQSLSRHEVDETMEKLSSNSTNLEVRDGSFQLEGRLVAFDSLGFLLRIRFCYCSPMANYNWISPFFRVEFDYLASLL